MQVLTNCVHMYVTYWKLKIPQVTVLDYFFNNYADKHTFSVFWVHKASLIN